MTIVIVMASTFLIALMILGWAVWKAQQEYLADAARMEAMNKLGRETAENLLKEKRNNSGQSPVSRL